MPFINRHHNIEQVLFWSNLASSHCTAIAMNSVDEHLYVFLINSCTVNSLLSKIKEKEICTKTSTP